LNNIKDIVLQDLLPRVQTPAQYTGSEWNMVRKDPSRVALRFCLAFPDTYSVGMSCAAVDVLYGALNEREDVYAERAFAPWTDMREAMLAQHVPLYSLETFTPLSRFDAIGFTLQYEMGFTNVLDMLELGGVPALSRERSATDPLVVAGGPCAFNPEPLADFIDLFALGDGEERICDLADACIALKREPPGSREEAPCRIVRDVPNVYAPSLYAEGPSGEGRGTRVAPRTDLPVAPPEVVTSAVVKDLDAAYAPERPIVPFTETIHDRIGIEIMRGCARGCRFCHAGMTRRPVRYRSVERIVALAEAQYAATGHSRIGLTSLSSSDYPDLERLIRELAARFGDRKVSVALPSLRVNDQLSELPALLKLVRKSALTIAPEAATDRLRRVINKDITEEDLFKGLEAAYRHGWQRVKLYFMVGLPTETDEDIVAIARVAEEASLLRKKVARSPARVNVSVATFVPKAHTPFETEPMVPLERMLEIRSLLRKSVRRKSVSLKFHRPERSFLEGVFARGDRLLGAALLAAHRLGCRFDAWDECFDFARWRQAFAETGIVPEDYANRARGEDEALPWGHLSPRVSRAFLRRERDKAERGEFTPDCRADGCQGCGVEDCPTGDASSE